MPIYEYECEACGETQEALVSRGRETPPCRKCGDRRLRRKLSAFAIGTSRDPDVFCAKHPDHCTQCPAKAELCPLPE
ncbi:MAG: zinc ribbon domain-containing protein [Armatimonadetes bacterium]|nr:zinc ribbon domain-containing protein [Armatimonadota bacterium]